MALHVYRFLRNIFASTFVKTTNRQANSKIRYLRFSVTSDAFRSSPNEQHARERRRAGQTSGSITRTSEPGSAWQEVSRELLPAVPKRFDEFLPPRLLRSVRRHQHRNRARTRALFPSLGHPRLDVTERRIDPHVPAPRNGQTVSASTAIAVAPRPVTLFARCRIEIEASDTDELQHPLNGCLQREPLIAVLGSPSYRFDAEHLKLTCHSHPFGASGFVITDDLRVHTTGTAFVGTRPTYYLIVGRVPSAPETTTAHNALTHTEEYNPQCAPTQHLFQSNPCEMAGTRMSPRPTDRRTARRSSLDTCTAAQPNRHPGKAPPRRRQRYKTRCHDAAPDKTSRPHFHAGRNSSNHRPRNNHPDRRTQRRHHSRTKPNPFHRHHSNSLDRYTAAQATSGK
jgi:hypothetical protein